jgi:hypothetical protein
MKRVRTWIAWGSGVYVLALVLVVMLWFFIPSFQHRAEAVCYWTDALVPGIKCSGERGDILSFLLNLPARLVWMPMFGLLALGSLAGLPTAAYLLAQAALCWAPIIYLAWHLFTRKRVPSAT